MEDTEEITNPVVNNDNAVGVQCIADSVTTTIQNVNMYHPETKFIKKPENFVFYLPKLIESFRGRDAELQQLSTWFFQDKRKMVAISGLPGYGKTELAKQFARHCKSNNKIKNIVWVNAESKDSLEDSFRDLLKTFTSVKSDIRAVVQNVYQYFEASSSIFIFDNAEDRQSVRDFEPPNECLCLVTSQMRDWGDDVASLELTSLSTTGAVAVLHSVLQQRYRLEDDEFLVQLAILMNCVPLALQVTAAYIRQEIASPATSGSFSFKQYVDQLTLNNDLIDKSVPNCSGITYKNSILQTLEISLNKIKNLNVPESSLAEIILNVCAYLNPENILVSDLLSIPLIKNLLLCSDNSTKLLKDALSLLNNYSFIRFVDDRIMIHRYVQNSLVYYQNRLNNQNNFYTTCLELILFGGNESHHHPVIKQADKNIDTFFNFYLNFKTHVLIGNVILKNLVATGCQLSLNKILIDLRTKSKAVIDKLNLLREAAVYGHHEILALLLSHGANVNAKDENGSTALSESVFNLDLKSVKLLTNNNADVNATDSYGYSALHGAIIAVGLPVYATKKEVAHEIIRLLIRCGGRVRTISNHGATLLHTAAYALQPYVVEMLITQYLLDVNAQDNDGWTPLHVVCCKNQVANIDEQRIQTAKVLLKYNAKLSIKNDEMRTPIELAYNEGLDSLAEFLENPLGERTQTQQQTYNKPQQKKHRCLVM